MDHAHGVSRQRGPSAQLGIRARAGRLQEFTPATRQVKLESLPSSSDVRLGHLNFPVLLMNLPLSLSAQIPNNAYMEDLSPSLREIYLDRAIAQFLSLYKHITQYALVYLLPSTPGFQDQPYVSNLGVVLPHCEEDTVILSRFRSAPRVGEDRIGADFFQLMNFTVERPPEAFEAEPVYFEGEADLKHIQGNLYIGAHGMRTSRNALRWAAERFEMEIIPFLITNPYLYHLDCCVLRIAEQAVLMCTSVADRICIEAVEQHCEIIDVSLQDTRAGITNCLLLPGEVLCNFEYHGTRQGTPQVPDREIQDRSPRDHLLSVRPHIARLLHVRILQVRRAPILPDHAHQAKCRQHAESRQLPRCDKAPDDQRRGADDALSFG